MSVFVISDLHLSTNADKSMEVFGSRWQNYTERLKNNWNALVESNDTVIVPGDISWGLTLDDAIPDLTFLDQLKGKKIIGKGNHDFWWQTLTKIKKAFTEHNITTIDILYNNSYIVENMIVCGTRGWYNGDKQIAVTNPTDNQKIVNREAIRLRLALQSAQKQQAETGYPIIVFLHFPPVWSDLVCREIMDVLHEFDIKKCYFGHIHGFTEAPREFVFENVSFSLVSSDHINFTPEPIFCNNII